MRSRPLKFEQLVQENKQELLDDATRISQIELRLEKKQTEPLRDKQKT
ncbi:FbpB family small basic protein [Lentibacillus salicampi]|uniref:FbpB family small basic protein n=1 Tax=Lentibacillus salicampi TaxID=175306 RepID=A0A4Y9AE31_9BACI|nr:FbpB family small basic protein [Lentibacillus salicampi]TFJ92641.1 FbpB family small basic protein [Lentibacillus salicampi]